MKLKFLLRGFTPQMPPNEERTYPWCQKYEKDSSNESYPFNQLFFFSQAAIENVLTNWTNYTLKKL